MEQQLISKKTFRYYTKGKIEKAKHLLIVLHGYGQLAEYFIKKFEDISEDYFIVAPEGMHRFYLKGSSGRVGASWMTKEAREIDIKDNLNWLNELYFQINSEKKFDKKIVLGFSQGGATAARWINERKDITSFILWASVFPPDLLIGNEIINFEERSNHFVLGNEDEYFTPDQQTECLSFFKENNYKTHVFNGKHTIDNQILQTILSEI
jgi:predicted esterase